VEEKLAGLVSNPDMELGCGIYFGRAGKGAK